MMRSVAFFIFFVLTSSYGQIVTPTERVLESLVFADDLKFKNLELAIERQLAAFNRQNLKGTVQYGETVYPRKALKESLELFLSYVQQGITCLAIQQEVLNEQSCLDEFNLKLNQAFDIYRPIPKKDEPGFGSKNTTLYTVYFSPDFEGSRVPTEEYKNPIYKLPPTEELKRKTREEIDFKGALANQGLELFWVKESLFELYVLHVEGGGRVRVKNQDGTESKVYLSYAGANGQKFEFIRKHMIEKGYLTSANASVDNQRAFIENNPHLAQEIYASNPSYIYFKETLDEPLGVDNIPLTEGRSLAIDTRIYKHVGVINFVKTQKATRDPSQNSILKTFSRFFISQDTGGAIRGNARCDLYFGFGPEAEFVAHNTKSQGEQYFLIKKNTGLRD